MNNNLRPEFRFPEFKGDWKEARLGEISEIYDGTHQTPIYRDNGIMFLSVENIKTLKSNKFISEEDFKKEFRIRPVKDDILMTRIGDVGTANVLTDSRDIAYYVSLALIKSIYLSPYFLKWNIHSPFMQREIWRRTLHIAFPKKINKNEIANVLINFPSEEEQRKIGDFFKQLEETIILHQQELATLKQTKQGFLQKMFPKEGKSVPELRFPEFNEKWRKHKLKEFGKASGGTPIESDFNENGKYKVISIGSYSEDSIYVDQGIRANETKKTKSRILNKNDLTMILNDKTSSGRIIGRVLLIDEGNSYVYNQRTERIEPDELKYDPQFLYQFLNSNSIRSKIIKSAQGNTQIYVNWSNISQIEYLIPTKDEQTRIGDFLKKLDKTIALHQQELEALKQTKKAFLQKMFV